VDQHDAAWNIFRMNQVKRAGEQQAGCETRLHAQPLLIQKAAQAAWGVQIKPPADENQHKTVNPHKSASRIPIDRP
jgi:hypothetical protein